MRMRIKNHNFASYLVAPFKNGFVAISSFSVVGSPCPGKITVSAGNGNKYLWMPSINSLWLPYGKSLRQTLPLNITSPPMTNPFSLKINMVPPGECPGICANSGSKLPIFHLPISLGK